MSETGWLIERPQARGGPAWWTGSGFSADKLKAIRFARKQDAERMMRHLRRAGELIATEHEWTPMPRPGAGEN